MNRDFNIFKLLISALLILLGLLATENLKACEGLDGVSLFGENENLVHLSDYKYEGIASNNEKIFHEIFSKKNNYLDFAKCRNALQVFVIKSKNSNTVYNALVTYEDSCDGGSTQGVLLDQGMKKILGIIHDNEISCL